MYMYTCVLNIQTYTGTLTPRYCQVRNTTATHELPTPRICCSPSPTNIHPSGVLVHIIRDRGKGNSCPISCSSLRYPNQ